ncbi:hypothetical protein PSPO01_15448 [Paraphaeosphaeria sporulosa]
MLALTSLRHLRPKLRLLLLRSSSNTDHKINGDDTASPRLTISRASSATSKRKRNS